VDIITPMNPDRVSIGDTLWIREDLACKPVGTVYDLEEVKQWKNGLRSRTIYIREPKGKRFTVTVSDCDEQFGLTPNAIEKRPSKFWGFL
jgi:hypothetical protein